ncbi:TRIC cation channel family protein [Tersicoccus sp. MR15.9]|uniref:trimeric intracellular cation channel family protein n=1 Tax=Tersicoccus mangrovi TaxID=3121635 RepID=UPI002FE544CC
MNASVTLLILDLVGVYFFAVSGSLLAARQRFDLVGSLLLASVTGLGGGVVRDLVLNAGPPVAFSQPLYLAPPVLAVVTVYFISASVQRFNRLLVAFDAAGLALFCVSGTLLALAAHAHPVAAALLGVTTAVGGGILRDVIANLTPALFDQREFYAIPAFIGATLTAIAASLGVLHPLTTVPIIVFVFGLRVAGRRLRWGIPLASRSVVE